MFCTTQKYLGHIFVDDIGDDEDIKRQIWAIYSRRNANINKFKHCSDKVKVILFKTYISNFYTSQLWYNYKKATMYQFKLAYNNIFRVLFSLDRRCSITEEMELRNIRKHNEVINVYIKSTYHRMNVSDNMLLKAITSSDVIRNSKLMRIWYNIYYEMNI